MLLTDLPDDAVQKIFLCLIREPVNYLNFASTCKRFSYIATKRVTTSPEWSQARSISFNLNLDLVKYSPELCKKHVHCAELQHRSRNPCELQQWCRKHQKLNQNINNNHQYRLNSFRYDSSDCNPANKQHYDYIYQLYNNDQEDDEDDNVDEDDDDDEDDDTEEDDEENDDDDDGDEDEEDGSDSEGIANHGVGSSRRKDKGERKSCYYHRLFCMLTAKYVTFSSLKFRQVRLKDRGCMRAFKDSLNYNRPLVELKINSLIELELYKCDISLDWLNTILCKMDNIKYLSLDEVSFIDPIILVESKDFASKVLKRLKITGDRSCSINDSIFTYFLDNFPAIEFDLSGTRLQYHKRIIQRFYSDLDSFDSFSMNPSESIFTFPIILRYLRRYRAVVKHFIADRTDITFTGLKKILQDDVLKHLNITIRECPMITQFERSRLADQIDESDLVRVTF